MREFIIIGSGMAVESTLTGQALRAIKDSDTVISTHRIARQISGIREDVLACKTNQLLEKALCSYGRTAIVVSGDPGFFSAAKKLTAQLESYGRVETLCGLSSMQYFFGKINRSYDDAVILSLHGRVGSIIGAVAYSKKVFALIGGEHKPGGLCEELSRCGLGKVNVYVGENLGLDSERILLGTAEELSRCDAGDLSVMYIENPRYVNSSACLRDSDFIRGDLPMTKEEIRWLVAAKMRINPEDTVYDIGAGTGSCSIEFARRASRGMVYAVEREARGVELIMENRISTGGFNVKVIESTAPEGLANLPAPNCAFIGGSAGHFSEILHTLLKINPGVRVVATAITIETLNKAMREMESAGLADVEIIQISASRAQKAGNYHMMMGQNPVYILSGTGGGGRI